MSRSLGRIFAAGIVWNPREPLPEEYRADPQYQGDWRPGSGSDGFNLGGSRRPGPSDGLTQLPPRQTNAFFVNSVVPQPGTVVATTKTVKKPAPRTVPELTIQEAGRNVLPPLSISLAASVIQDTAEVTVTQTFWNNAIDPIKEAAYTFPLPTSCTVTDFSCRIGTNRIIRGSVKPREEAREAFKQHIRHHKTGAALLEQDTPEIFTTTLGNIPPEARLKVTLSFITVLKHRFSESLGTTTLTIPTYIASRYGSPPEGYKHAESKEVPQGLMLKIEIIESEKVQSITSPSHAVTLDHRKGKATAESFADLAGEGGASQVDTTLVQLEGSSTFLDKDFVLDIVTHPNGDNETPQAWLEEHPTLPNQKALMVTLPPKFLGQTTPVQMNEKSEILFLADQSGSMYDKVDSLKSAMEFFLKGIPVGKTFNIWSFGSDYSSWCPQSVDYNEGTLSAALAHVDKTFDEDMGGTELFPAIQAVVAARDKSLMSDIIVLTDGETWRLDDTLDFIQKTRVRTEGRVRFFSLGIGDGVSHALVEGIAKAGGGYAEVVPSSVRDGWEDRVVSMLQASLLTAHLGPLHFDFALDDKTTKTSIPINLFSPESSQRSPADISTLTPFNHNRVYFLTTAPGIPRASKDSSITLFITSSLTPNSPLAIPVVVLPKKATTIHKLAARSLLNDLERGQSYLHLKQPTLYRGTWAETSVAKREAEEIACKWGLVSKWTSFFLKEEPFEPKEGSDVDLFLDGAVIKATLGQGAMGDDLLQIRGPTTAPEAPAVEEATRGVEQAVEEQAEALPIIQDGRVVRVGEEDEEELALEMEFRADYYTQASTTATNRNDYSSMPSFSVTSNSFSAYYPVSPPPPTYGVSAYYPASSLPQPSPPPPAYPVPQGAPIHFWAPRQGQTTQGQAMPSIQTAFLPSYSSDEDGHASAPLPRRRRTRRGPSLSPVVIHNGCPDSDGDDPVAGVSTLVNPAQSLDLDLGDSIAQSLAELKSPPSPARSVGSSSLGRHVQTFGDSDEDYGARSSGSPGPESPEGSSRDRNRSRPPSRSVGASKESLIASAMAAAAIAGGAVPGTVRANLGPASGKKLEYHKEADLEPLRERLRRLPPPPPGRRREHHSDGSSGQSRRSRSGSLIRSGDRHGIAALGSAALAAAALGSAAAAGQRARSKSRSRSRSARSRSSSGSGSLFRLPSRFREPEDQSSRPTLSGFAIGSLVGSGSAGLVQRTRSRNRSRTRRRSARSRSRSRSLSSVRDYGTIVAAGQAGAAAPKIVGNKIQNHRSRSRSLTRRPVRFGAPDPVQQARSRSQSRTRSARSRSRSRSLSWSRLLSDAVPIGSAAAGLAHRSRSRSRSRTQRRSAGFRSRSHSRVRMSADIVVAGLAGAGASKLIGNHNLRQRRRSPSYSSSVSSRAGSPASARTASPGRAPLTEQSWIRLVLRHQKFNGAISLPPSTDPIAEVCLGKEILAVVDRLCASSTPTRNDQDDRDEVRAFFVTLAVHVVLVRDFAAHAKLVALMKAKMWRFLETACKARGGGKSLEAWRAEVEGVLGGLRVPVHVYLEKGEGGGGEEGVGESGKGRVMVETKVETKALPGRELVLSAPFDD